ncbi:MAG: glycosyltransferase, partial [Verrucomicrobiaceae bacterium]
MIRTLWQRTNNNQMDEGKKIAAIFATMNRAETAMECLRRLHGQSVRPDFIVVADNRSTDETVSGIKALGEELRLEITVLALKENLGNAGGIREAMDHAFRAGAGAVWILDDDSWPEPDSLKHLLDPEGPVTGIRSSMVSAPDGSGASWPLETQAEGARWKLEWNPVRGNSGPWIRIRRAWLGIL